MWSYGSDTPTLSDNLFINYNTGCLDTLLAALSLSLSRCHKVSFLPDKDKGAFPTSASRGLGERPDNGAPALSFMLKSLALLAC